MKRKHGHPEPRSRAKAGGAPGRHEPTLSDAIGLLRAGRLSEAAATLSQIVNTDPENWQATHLLGLTAFRRGSREQAVDLLRRCLAIKPNLAEAHSDLCAVLKELGRLEEAREACNEAIALKPAFFPAHVNLGNILKAMGRLEEAVETYKVALALEPNCAEAHANLGTVLVMLGRADDAVGHCRRAAALTPGVAEVHAALGHALRRAGRSGEALPELRRVIEIRPAFAAAYTELAGALEEVGQFEAALRAHEQALTLEPDLPEARNGLGLTLQRLGRYDEAAEQYRKAVASKAGYAEAWSNLGAVLGLCGQHDEAAAACRRAIEISPRDVAPYLNLAAALKEQGRTGEAAAACAKVLAIAPDQPAALAEYYHLRRRACDWANLAPVEERLLQDTYGAARRAPPWPLLDIPCGPETHLAAARAWASGLPRAIEEPFTYEPLRKRGKGRLRIGYLSTDFGGGAAADCLAGLLEHHDRGRFEVFGYGCGRGGADAGGERLAAAFDHFAAIGALSHGDAARAIHDDGITILVDLDGYTEGARTEIAACRPAPIQVNSFGYPATMGADFIDYIIADPFVLPMDETRFYDEKVVHLPHCHRPDGTPRNAAPVPARGACGLPDSGFVFCCFNSPHKIEPERFALWMRLLEQVPGAVLWLPGAHSTAAGNLRREAMAHGVDPARLVFAPVAERAEHLARLQLADLFLDTAPAGAQAAAADAMWAGLPVLTCSGDTFVSRVCGSLLHAAELPELVTGWPEEYEAAALRLARDGEALRELRERLVKQRLAAPLFDIRQYVRDLEAAFDHMAALRAAGHTPRAFAVAEIGKERLEPAVPAHRRREKAAAEASAGPASDVRIAYEACPLCGSESMTPLREADCTGHPSYTAGLPPFIAWNQCGTCGHVFTAGYLSREAAEAVSGTAGPEERVGHDLEAQRVIAARIIEHIVPHVPKAPPRPKVKGARAKAVPPSDGALGDWLDARAGNGSLVFTAQEWGFRAVGLDPRRENVEALTALGYEAYLTGLDEVSFPGRFSAVCMADVLERTPFPKTALTAAYNLLRPQGILFLSMPNMDTMVWRVLDTQSSNPYWGEIGHYHNFSRARLYALLEEQGFSPLAYHISERNRACMEVIAARR